MVTITQELYATSTFHFDHASDAELSRNVEGLKKQVGLLRLENEVLEASIMSLQPSLMSGLHSALESVIKLKKTFESRTTFGSGSRSSTLGLYETTRSYANMLSKSRSLHWNQQSMTSSDKMSRSIICTQVRKINIEQRLELVHVAMEALGKDLKKAGIEGKKKRALLYAKLEELELRSKDIEKLTADFEHDVVIEGVEAVTKRIPAETWIRFLTDNGKKIDKQIAKMRLRFSTTNAQYIKLRADRKIKKELAERLLPIDFEMKTIDIENNHKTMERKSKDLIGIKAMAGYANLNIIRHKYKLMDLTNYLHRVKKLKIERERQTKELNAESAKLAVHVDQLEHQLNKIKNLREAYSVPDIFEYVSLKFKICGLNRDIQRLETSLGIKKYALINFKKELWKSKILFSKMNLGSCEEPSKAT